MPNTGVQLIQKWDNDVYIYNPIYLKAEFESKF